MKKQGVKNPEEHVLTQYYMPSGDRPPIPIDADDYEMQGMLILNPEEGEALDKTGRLPLAGGVIGTVKSLFRTLGFVFSDGKPVDKVEEPEPESRAIAKTKRRGGLYGSE